VFLRKIAQTRFAKLTRQYFAWTGLIFMLLVGITAFSSLDLIRLNRFAFFDVLITYAFMMLWAFLDALLVSVVLAGLEVLVERLLHGNYEKLFRIPVILGFIAIWLYLLRLFIPFLVGA